MKSVKSVKYTQQQHCGDCLKLITGYIAKHYLRNSSHKKIKVKDRKEPIKCNGLGCNVCQQVLAQKKELAESGKFYSLNVIKSI